MVQGRCRALPLVSAGKLVGVVSLRGLQRLEARDPLARSTRCAFDAIEEPLVAVRGTPVAEVAAEMANGRFELAIIVERGRVIGVFTEGDAMRALASFASGRANPKATAA